MMEEVILVDSGDNQIGVMEKMQAHREAKLHRAFSVFLWNENNELLLQQRQLDKYHCGGLWANTCCSHPREGEKLVDAVNRRLEEEMGIVCDTSWIYSFIYKADLGGGLFEHEFDHVFFGAFSGQPKLNVTEVADWKYIGLDELKKDIAAQPNQYTPWFKIILNEVVEKGLLNSTAS